MYIHFAFSSLKKNPEKQICNLIDLILEKRHLRFGKNPEFIPVINAEFMNSNVKSVHVENFQKGEDFVQLDVSSKIDNPLFLFKYIRVEIKIICFINTSFDELKSLTQLKQYGKVGLIFDEKFLIDNSLKEVYYYTEGSLIYDPLILEWNFKYARRSNLSAYQIDEKRRLELEILTYRKPSRLFKSLFDSRIIVIGGPNEGIMESYGRYPLGYDFTKEKEWRILSKTQNDYLFFEEKALKGIIVPNIECKKRIEDYFKSNWITKPEIFIIH